MKIKISSLLLIMAMASGCTLFETPKDDEMKKTFLILAALTRNSGGSSGRDMYAGFADIPSSIMTASSSSISPSIQADSRTLASSDYKFSSSSYSVSKVYDRVKAYATSVRYNAKQIGDLVKTLEAINVTGTNSSPQQGTSTWLGINSKYQYQPSSVLTGGKKLEVWWNNGATPYSNNKAIELNYTGSSSGTISGFAFVRFPFMPPSTASAVPTVPTTVTTLSTAYINFSYNSSTNTRTMVIIFQGIPGIGGTTYTDKAHFYIQEVNGVTTMDGTFTVSDYDASNVATTMTNINSTSTSTVTLSNVSTSARAYVFSAIGNSSKAIIRAALPLTTDGTTTGIYLNTVPNTCTTSSCPGLANMGQVWTNFLLANSTNTTIPNFNTTIGGICGSSFIMPPTATIAGNPTSFTSVTAVGTLKTCLDAIISVGQGSIASSVKDLYFLTNVKNPVYFSVSGSTSSLYGVESLDTTDANYTAFNTLETNSSFLNFIRTTSNQTYSAAFDVSSVGALNLFQGTNIPLGTSAANLTNLNAQWGGDPAGSGTSSATAPSNFINGSIDNTAPF